MVPAGSGEQDVGERRGGKEGQIQRPWRPVRESLPPRLVRMRQMGRERTAGQGRARPCSAPWSVQHPPLFFPRCIFPRRVALRMMGRSGQRKAAAFCSVASDRGEDDTF